MSVTKRTLKVQSHGVVKGGELTYTATPETGALSVKGHLKYSALFKSGEIPVDADTTVDPEILKSANVKPGMVLDIGDLKITVVSVKDKWASCALRFNGKISATGNAIFDLSEDTLSLNSVAAHGSVFGFGVDIVASV